MIGWEEEVLRIVIGAALGGMIGLEREVRGQAAGFRTHTLVAMGATLFTLVSIYGFNGIAGPAGQLLPHDPSRVAAQIVVGIGFLGAGAIMRHGTSVKGITTAASLWVVAAMGLAVGAGYYLGAVTAFILLFVILRALRTAEGWIIRRVRPDEAALTVRIENKKAASHDVLEFLEHKDILVREISIDSTPDETILRLSVKFPRQMKAERVLEELGAASGVLGAHWKR